MLEKNLKLVLVVGARPNFMKMAPLIRAIEQHNQNRKMNLYDLSYILVHTGQHYDMDMSQAFFRDLQIPNPDVNLEVGSSSHAVQTANIMIRFESICSEVRPDWIIVVGDVNSTMACALVAAKMEIKIAHVEAGLRSFDRSMPEEINRVVTDSVADLLFTPSEDADENLLREGITPHKIRRVGNIMIDTLASHLEQARQRKPYDRFGLKPGNYIFVTLHRPSNVDEKDSLSVIMDQLYSVSQKIPVVFPMHPRTRKNSVQFGVLGKQNGSQKMIICNPLGYHDTIGFVDRARFVLTDSGGLQEETTFLNVPCLTLRPNTERPITITKGTNRLTSLGKLGEDMDRLLNSGPTNGILPELWDGKTAERVVNALINFHNQLDSRELEMPKEPSA